MKVEVLPGHSVQTPGGAFFPGETLELGEAKSKRLIVAGIVKEVKTAVETPPKPNVAETVKLVEAAASAEGLDKLAEGESRKGVLDAIAKRRAELAPKE